ncbi:MAG: HAD family hydrolase [Ruminococcus sp.]|jgi:phosphoglycolate phosphatase|nr:HAD family hydrolase [Ruminococcus sp.]
MTKNKIIVFDFDGTIADTLTGITISGNYALSSLGFPQRTYEEFKMFIGDAARITAMRALPDGYKDEEYIEKYFVTYRQHYFENQYKSIELYSGIIELLEELTKENKLAVLTNKNQDITDSLIEFLGIGKYFTQITGVTDGPVKPQPDVLWDIIKSNGFEVADAIMVGDSAVDINTAKNAGVTSIGVSYGYGDVSGADCIASSPKEILTAINAMV